MSIFNRGNVYWYHFLFNGEHFQKSTKPARPRFWRSVLEGYRTQIGNITAYAPLVNRKLDSITSGHTADYSAHLQAKGWKPRAMRP
jgi:hypothetical protein